MLLLNYWELFLLDDEFLSSVKKIKILEKKLIISSGVSTNSSAESGVCYVNEPVY